MEVPNPVRGITELLASVFASPPLRVAVDESHALLILGAALSAKPLNLLELGIGSGYVTRTLLAAIAYNGVGKLTSVDNWKDWNGVKPDGIAELEAADITVVAEDEGPFLKAQPDAAYDFVVSDADHRNAHKHLPDLLRITTPSGVIFIHDASNQHLINALNASRRPYKLFAATTRPGERCERGTAMLFNQKPKFI